MNFMFLDAPAYNSDISSWNVARVSNMYFMFAHAAAYNSDLSAWNVANVSDMTSMFGSASSFNSNLADWNVASVSTTNNMFRSAEAFDRNIAGWNVLSMTSLSGAPLRLCPVAPLLRSHAAESAPLVPSLPAPRRRRMSFAVPNPRFASAMYVPPTE